MGDNRGERRPRAIKRFFFSPYNNQSAGGGRSGSNSACNKCINITAVLNGFKTLLRRLRFCIFSLLFFLYPCEKERKFSLIIPMKSPEIPRNPQKPPKLSIFLFILPFLAVKGKDCLPDYPYENPQKSAETFLYP